MNSQKLKSGDLIEQRFRVKNLLGSGGFGSVWSAHDQETGADIAIKLLHPHLLHSPWILERFTREAEILSRFAHPRVARCIHAGTTDGNAYMCIELVQGASLHDVLLQSASAGRPIELSNIVKILEQLASALDYAHENGIIHRDLKPKNIMIAEQNNLLQAKLLDFGIAKILYDTAKDSTTVGRLLGSLLYLSPEQALSEAISPPSDIFSLATVAFELLTSRRTWAWDKANNPILISRQGIMKNEMNNHLSILSRIVSGTRPIAHRFRPELPTAASEVLIRALSAAPEDRYDTAGLFVAALKECIRDEQVRPVDLVGEDSLTHVVSQSAPGKEAGLVVPTEYEAKDFVPGGLPVTRSGRDKIAVPLNLDTPILSSSNQYESIQLQERKSLPQFIVLLIGLIIGISATYILVRPTPATSPQVNIAPKAPKNKLTAIDKPQQKVTPPKPKPETSKKPKSQKPTPKPLPKKTIEPVSPARVQVSPLDKAWASFQKAPEDLDKMDKFQRVLRKEIVTNIPKAERTSMLRCIKLAEFQASLEQFEECLKNYKQKLK